MERIIVAPIAAVERANAEFWNELCGSVFARALGIREHSRESLERFDHAYFEFYPYLLQRVKLGRMAGKKVLEIGLGYGTLGQAIASAGADYIGLDIAQGPVRMMRHRLHLRSLPGVTVQGSILHAPFASEGFDHIVAIGCYHHTGNVQQCIDETFRLLKPGGIAEIMVYNRYSYRQWLTAPQGTMRAAFSKSSQMKTTVEQRRAYDVNVAGHAAPETTFLSIGALTEMFGHFSRCEFHKENCDGLPGPVDRLLSRKRLLPLIGKRMGLDIYIEAHK